MIHSPAKGYNKSCGPTALALLLGITTDEAARRIRTYTGKKMARGTAVSTMLVVLERAGFKLIKVPTIGAGLGNLNTKHRHYSTGFYFAWITHHYVVLERKAINWTIVDNQKKTPVPLHQHKRYLKTRIKQLWYLVPPALPVQWTDFNTSEEPSELKQLLSFTP